MADKSKQLLMHLLRTSVFTGLFLLSSLYVLHGQPIDVLPLEQTNDSYSFPVLTGRDTKNRVCEKMNTYLQVHYLSQVPGTYVSDDPYHFVKNGFRCGQTVFQEFSASHLNSRVLEMKLSIEQSYCTGMGLDWITKVDYFDVVRGEKIELADLFSEGGFRSLKTETIHEMRSQLQGYIDEIKEEMRGAELDEQDRQFLLDQSDLYQDCLKYTEISEFESYQYKIAKRSITFRRNNCYWNETGRSLDEKPVPSVQFSLESLEPLLSAYGNELLVAGGAALSNPSLNNKILKGYIGGKYPIKAIIKQSGQQPKIIYWYEKVKQPLIWSGKQVAGKYHLQEKIYSDDESEDIAEVVLTFNKNERWTAQGTWKELSTGKLLSIDLEEY